MTVMEGPQAANQLDEAAGRTKIPKIALRSDDGYGRLASAKNLSDRLSFLRIAAAAAQAMGIEMADLVGLESDRRESLFHYIDKSGLVLADAALVTHG